jgi:hypothetical protein
MLEALFEELWCRSPGFIQLKLSQLAYGICEALCGFTKQNTSCTLLAAGEALAAFQVLDVSEARRETDLPNSVLHALAPFTDEEWKEVLVIARSRLEFMERDLTKPQWEHLRKGTPNDRWCSK